MSIEAAASKHHKPDEPIILKQPRVAAMWVRTQARSYVLACGDMLRAELRRHQPEIDLYDQTKAGDPKRISVKRLIKAYGRRVDKIHYDLAAKEARYIPDDNGGGELYIDCVRRPAVEAAFNEEVDTWLRLFAGDRADALLDWLATIGRLGNPAPALYLEGPTGNGKGLFAEGCSESFGYFTSYNDIAWSGFNGALTRCPIVILDHSAAKRDSGFFLKFMSNNTRELREKHQPVATLLGWPRLIITDNDPNALRVRESLAPEDKEAIRGHILHINTSKAARSYLDSIGSRQHTRNWVRHEETYKPGEFCQHLAWLEANREVAHD